jgi:hypothetical protein
MGPSLSTFLILSKSAINPNMKKYNINVVFFVLILGISESLSAQSVSLNEDQIKRYTEEIIFNQPSLKNTDNCIYLDSNLIYRPKLFPIFRTAQNFDLMLSSYPSNPIPLSIPDSLKKNFKFYRSSQVVEIMRDTVTVSLYSPLLPTKEEGVYILQEYRFIYAPEGNSRIAVINYSKYKIEGGKIVSSSPIEYGLNATAWEAGTSNGW